MKFTEHTIVINGETFFYLQKNPEKKEVVIFLHGFPGSHAGLIDLAESLDECRVVVPDLPACGQSGLLQKHVLKSYSAWLDGFMESLAIKQAVVIGHSFGARVTLSFSMHYPKRIIKMVLITPVLKIDGLIAYFIALHCNIAKLLPNYLRKTWLANGFYRKVSHAILFKSADAKKRKEIMQRDYREYKKVEHRVILEIFEEFYHSNLIDLSDKNKVESLIIAGGSDYIVSLDSIKDLSYSLVNSKAEIMENSGHLVPLEDPLGVSNIIKKYLKI